MKTILITSTTGSYKVNKGWRKMSSSYSSMKFVTYELCFGLVNSRNPQWGSCRALVRNQLYSDDCCFSFYDAPAVFLFAFLGSVSNTRDSVSSGYPNIEKSIESTTHSGVLLTKFEVFVYLMNHCTECLINLLSRNKN